MTNKHELKRIPREEISYEQDARYYHDGKWFTGWATSMHRHIREEQEFRLGFRWGTAYTYNAKGILILESHFRMDLLYGKQREWNDDGHLIYEAQYEHGVLIEEKEWDESEEITKHFEHREVSPHLAEMRQLYGTPEQVAEEEAAYRQGA